MAVRPSRDGPLWSLHGTPAWFSKLSEAIFKYQRSSPRDVVTSLQRGDN